MDEFRRSGDSEMEEKNQIGAGKPGGETRGGKWEEIYDIVRL